MKHMREFSEDTAIVVLDDDPTGTQTVHNIPVLTTWEEATLEVMFREGVPLFYILTNTRAFSEEKAVAINAEIGGTLKKLETRYQRRVLPISRSDSTLRGHFPAEVDALSRGMGYQNPLVFLVPAFIEGGRLTVDGIHYLLQEGVPVPVAETPFAQDPVFGYTKSDLTQWVLEKSGDRIRPAEIRKVGSADWQRSSCQAIAEQVSDPACKVVVADAATYDDLAQIALLIRRVMAQGREVVIRSAASIVKTLGNLEAAPLLWAGDLMKAADQRGGLVVVGSFVPISTLQVAYLMDHVSMPAYILNIEQATTKPADYLISLARKVEEHIRKGETALIYTERSLKIGNSREENIQIGKQYSELLVTIVHHIREVPAFVVAKGGITSSDIATRGLGIKKARVLGQVAAGVSVWEPGADSRLSGFPYVVFPGNVGNEQTLYEVVQAFLGDDPNKIANS
jgi:uncharacterized protein YgbK (DUF1537 family)